MKNQTNEKSAKRAKPNKNGAMRRLFNMDNPFMKALSIAADLLILNILTVVLSIPIITMGPAIIAMHDVIIRIVRGEEGYTIQPFFHAFKANFKRGALMSLILAGAAGILYVDYLAAATYIPIMKAGIIAIGVILLSISFYAFALEARYENKFGATLKNAAMLAVANFPKTLFMVICSVGLWLVCIHFYKIGTPILIMFGLSMPCYVNILLINGIFRKLEGDEDNIEEEGDEKGSTFWKRFYQNKK